MVKILLVDDEPDIVEFLKYNLEKEKYKVIEAFNGSDALKLLHENPDLILLDIMLPDIDGFELCKKIKEKDQYQDIPIIFLTALSSENHEVEGLGLGAADFITKPISPQKLSARVKAGLRFRKIDSKVESTLKDKIKIGELLIDIDAFKITIGKKEIAFPKKEFQLLHFLASHPDKVFSRESLLKHIWGEEAFVIDRTVDVHVRKIRQKLGDYSDHIQTIKGIGYKFLSK